MSTIDPLLIQIPRKLTEDPQTEEYFRYLHGIINALITALNGDTETIPDAIDAATTTADKVDILTNELPVYTITNDVTTRALNAADTAASVGVDVAAVTGSQVALVSEVNAIVTQQNVMSDVLATVVNDLAEKNVLGP